MCPLPCWFAGKHSVSPLKHWVSFWLWSQRSQWWHPGPFHLILDFAGHRWIFLMVCLIYESTSTIHLQSFSPSDFSTFLTTLVSRTPLLPSHSQLLSLASYKMLTLKYSPLFSYTETTHPLHGSGLLVPPLSHLHPILFLTITKVIIKQKSDQAMAMVKKFQGLSIAILHGLWTRSILEWAEVSKETCSQSQKTFNGMAGGSVRHWDANPRHYCEMYLQSLTRSPQ